MLGAPTTAIVCDVQQIRDTEFSKKAHTDFYDCSQHDRGDGNPWLYSVGWRTGYVIVIGGGEDKVRERVILTRFIELAGGHDARIAVISTASSLGPLAGEMYRACSRSSGPPTCIPFTPAPAPSAPIRYAVASVREAPRASS